MTCWVSDRPRPPYSLGQPTHVHPRGAERALPREPLLEQRVLVAGAAAAAHDGELAVELLGEPGPGLLAEGLVLGGEPQVHACRLLVGGAPNLASGFGGIASRNEPPDPPTGDTLRCPTSTSADEIKAAVGTHLGFSDWLEIDQARIDQFADATGDHQWIHVDPEQRQGRPVRYDDRARLPDAVDHEHVPAAARHGVDGEAGHQLRREQGALPRAGARRLAHPRRRRGHRGRGRRRRRAGGRPAHRRGGGADGKIKTDPRASSTASAAGCSERWPSLGPASSRWTAPTRSRSASSGPRCSGARSCSRTRPARRSGSGPTGCG